MKYQIICITRNKNDSINQLGFVEAGNSTENHRYIEDKEEINKKIRNGSSFFFTDKDGEKTDVIAVEDEYVRTSPDGTKKNNLLHLNKCRL